METDENRNVGVTSGCFSLCLPVQRIQSRTSRVRDMSEDLLDPLTLQEEINEEKTQIDANSLWEHEPLAQLPVKVLRGHADSITSCHFCFHDTRLLTSSHDKTVILWDVETGGQLMVLTGGHSGAITACCLIPEMNRVITSSWDKTLNAWDLETGKILWTVTQGGLLMSCSVSGDGKYVASASDMENALYVNCAATGQRLHYFPGHHTSTVMSCRFDAQSQHVASVSADRSIKLWDVCSHKTTLSINSAHTNVISSCCFTQNGRYLCTASWDRTLQLWDVQTGSFRTRGGEQLSKGHNGSISSCAFSSDASFLVSGAYDRTVALWDVKGLYRTLVLKGHQDWVTDVDISADKNWVVSSSKDCTVRLWNIEQHERIPAVRESRKVHGHEPRILQCEECGKIFSICLSETRNSSPLCVFSSPMCVFSSPTCVFSSPMCVFCRLKTPHCSLPSPPPL